MSCQSGCSATTRSVVAVSQSGRVWVGHVCEDEEHLDMALSAVKGLGFTVKSIDEMEAVQ